MEIEGFVGDVEQNGKCLQCVSWSGYLDICQGPEVRRQLISQKGYREEELPTAATIATKLNQLGYYPTQVAKSKPQKSLRPLTPSSSI
jgi:hypothetical protein